MRAFAHPVSPVILRGQPRRAALLLVVFTLLVSVAGVPLAPVASAGGPNAIRNLPGFDGSTLSRNDDGYTGQVPLGFTIDFFGRSYSNLYVNNNGNVTFQGPSSTYTPYDLSTTNNTIIAGFFADVDTRCPRTGEVRYGRDTVDGRPAFAANYVNVGYYPSGCSPLNSFQIVLIDRSDTGTGNFDIELNYDQVLWDLGRARAGYANGTREPGTFFELPGSGVSGALLDSNLATGLIRNSMGTSQLGRYVFNVRAGRPLDTVAPTITGSRSPAPNAAGWSNTDVTVSFTCADNIAVASCSGPTTPSADGVHSVEGIATDTSDNSATTTVSDIRIDRTAPSLSGTATTPPNAAGWYRSDVTVAWSCADALSGVVTCPQESTIGGEGRGLTAGATVTDRAGNATSAASAPAVNIDRTAPVTTMSAPSGWQNEAVTVALSATDNLSGVASTYYRLNGGAATSGSSVVITAEGTHTLQVWSVDAAGNVEGAQTVQVLVDRTAPTITHTQAPAANAAGWNNSDVTVTFTCADGLSGVASCSDARTVTTEGERQAATGHAVDFAGNTATDPATVSIDKTRPTITATVSGAANGNGWYATPALVEFRCGDGLSGVALCEGGTVLGEGANQSVTGTAADAAGNTAATTVAGVNIDLTAPTIAGAVVTEANAHGWYRGDVVVRWTCQDTLAGVVVCPAETLVTGEGEGLSATASVSDAAGNTATATVSGINIDRTAPGLAGVTATEPNVGEWYRGDVIIAWACADDLSGIAACPPNSTITGEGKGLTSAASVADRAGNSTSASSAAVNIDRTAPVTTVSAPSAWQNDSVSVTLTGDDVLSKVAVTRYELNGGATQTGSSVLIEDEGVHTLEFWSVDVAGNVEDRQTVTISVDKSAPTITHTQSPLANAAGWNNTDVVITFTCTDALSGIVSCTEPQSVTSEGAGQTVTGRALDAAGNSATDPATVSIDKTAPTISGAATSDPNGNGWHAAPVTVRFTCRDSVSAVAECTPAQTVGEGADQSVPGEAVDVADNSAQVLVTGIDVDLTPPTIAGAPTGAANASGWYRSAVAVTWTCHDALSGVVACPADSIVAGEGSALSTTGAVTDRAGNTAAAQVAGINIDGTAPSLSGTPVSAPNDAGWYRDDVTVAWVCADALSGVAACPGDSTVTGEGVALTVGAAVEDRAGNATSATSAPAVNIDRTPPVTEVSSPSAWQNESTTIRLTPADNLSGVAATYYRVNGGPDSVGTSLELTQEGVHTVEAWSIDSAGNVEAAHTVTVMIDKTAPTIMHAQAPEPNAAGWNNTDVTVTFTCADGLSGVASCTGPQPIAAEGQGQQVTGEAVDEAGNTATDTAAVSIDKTAPTVSGAPASAPNDNGWYAAPVSVQFTCADALSGIAACTPAQTIGEGQGQSVTGHAADAAENTSTTTVAGINVDVTPPTIAGALTTEPNGNGWYRADVVVRWTCADNLSGVVACPNDTVVTGEGANLEVSAAVTDAAGHTTTATVSGINIDRTPPAVLYGGNAGVYDADQAVAITCTASDSLSGLESDTCADVTGDAYAFGLGTHTYAADATDNAGNHTTSSTSFEVVVTYDSLRALTIRFFDQSSLTQSLIVKLNAAEAAERRGNVNTKRNNLHAYGREVEAQTNKAVTSDEATVLTTLAAAL